MNCHPLTLPPPPQKRKKGEHENIELALLCTKEVPLLKAMCPNLGRWSSMGQISFPTETIGKAPV